MNEAVSFMVNRVEGKNPEKKVYLDNFIPRINKQKL